MDSQTKKENRAVWHSIYADITLLFEQLSTRLAANEQDEKDLKEAREAQRARKNKKSKKKYRNRKDDDDDDDDEDDDDDDEDDETLTLPKVDPVYGLMCSTAKYYSRFIEAVFKCMIPHEIKKELKRQPDSVVSRVIKQNEKSVETSFITKNNKVELANTTLVANTVRPLFIVLTLL